MTTYDSGTKFSHNTPNDTKFLPDGLREFFEYRDLGVKDATHGNVLAHITRAKKAPVEGTGWHYHTASFQIVYMLKGWAKFMYEDQVTLVNTGDCVHQKPGIVHYLFDYSSDMEYLEIISPADYGSIPVAGPCTVPAPGSWSVACD